MANYDPKSLRAEEFINHEEILATLAYAQEHKNDVALIDAILEKAREQAARILRDARIASDTVLAQLDEMKKQANTNAADQNLAAARAALRSTLGQAEKKA